MKKKKILTGLFVAALTLSVCIPAVPASAHGHHGGRHHSRVTSSRHCDGYGDCSYCDGTGRYKKRTCTYCDGSGNCGHRSSYHH